MLFRSVHNAFIPFGPIVEVNLPTPPPNPKDPTPPQHRGFGYVEFENEEDAAAALDNMDLSMLDGRVLKVAKAKAVKEVGEGLGSKKAVWEQEGWLEKYAVKDEDRIIPPAADGADPMKGLEGLDVAGPKEA